MFPRIAEVIAPVKYLFRRTFRDIQVTNHLLHHLFRLDNSFFPQPHEPPNSHCRSNHGEGNNKLLIFCHCHIVIVFARAESTTGRIAHGVGETLNGVEVVAQGVYLASSSGLFICVGVKKRPGIDCNAHARNLHINRCFLLFYFLFLFFLFLFLQ